MPTTIVSTLLVKDLVERGEHWRINLLDLRLKKSMKDFIEACERPFRRDD